MRRQPHPDGSLLRTDAALDLRRILFYAEGLVAIYMLGVGVIIATYTQNHP